MKILVTGGAGYIGSACVDVLVEAGHSVVVFDNLSTGQADKVSDNALLLRGDLVDKAAVMQLCSEYQFDSVIHFAAKKAVAESEENPSLYFENNVVGTFNLLNAIDHYKIPKLIFSSTAAVYTNFESEPVTETTKTDPASVYGASKLMVEDMINAYRRTGKLESFSILRYFNVAGDAGLNYKEEKAQNVFPIIARSIKNGEPFNIFGTDYDTIDGTGVRDYIHLRDLVEAHVFALLTETTGTYNLGTGTGYSVRQLVAEFERQLGKKVLVAEQPRRAGDVAAVVADASLAETALGWKPKLNLADMVEDTLRVYGA